MSHTAYIVFLNFIFLNTLLVLSELLQYDAPNDKLPSIHTIAHNEADYIKPLVKNKARYRAVFNTEVANCLDWGIDPHLGAYDIESNLDGSGRNGSVITIFYSSQLGLYPSVGSTGRLLHGGIPQVNRRHI